MASTRNTPTAPSRHRRLAARSVIASTLLGLRPPRLRTADLVAGAELLGVSQGTARVAISRMVAAGELEPTGDGYRLAGHLLARQARQDLSRVGPPGPWDGRWRTLVVLPSVGRTPAARAELRRSMGALRFAELREGVWLRPANLPSGLLAEDEDRVRAATTAIVGRVEDEVATTDRLWDLGTWAARAEVLLGEIADLQAALDRDDAGALAESFVVAAATLRHLQADPLLPTELLPALWPGPDLRGAHERFERSFRLVLRTWHLARADRVPGAAAH